MSEDYRVTVSAGTLRDDAGADDAGADAGTYARPHAWTPGGVRVSAPFTGAHLLHLAVAGCVLNDLFREAAALGVPLAGAQVTAWGGFDPGTWASGGIAYAVRLDGPGQQDADRLLERVDAVAEIPRAVRQGTTVQRVSGPARPPGPPG